MCYRYGFNGKEKDVDDFGDVHYDYGFRIYNPRLGKFLTVDPLTKGYPMLTPYQFASNMPIAAIDLDGLEAMLAIYGAGGKVKGDEVQFKAEAERDIKRGLAEGKAIRMGSANDFINLLVAETKKEGSIGYLFVISHGSPNAILFDNTRYAGGSALNIFGDNWSGYDNKGIDDIAYNKEIAFDKTALCVFAGCNMGLTRVATPGAIAIPFASMFTDLIGVPTIAAEGGTMPDGDKRVADYTYYLFEKVDNDVVKTPLGKELTQDLIKQVYGYLKRQNNLKMFLQQSSRNQIHQA